jgi:hypothetical protein
MWLSAYHDLVSELNTESTSEALADNVRLAEHLRGSYRPDRAGTQAACCLCRFVSQP